MDSFFGIGLPELVVILILAGLVMGPHRIRQVARWLGLMTAKLQAISRSFMRQLNTELDSMDGGEELRGAMQDVQDLRRQVESLRQELRSSTTGAVTAGQQAWRETENMARRSIAPPMLKDEPAQPKTGADDAHHGAPGATPAPPPQLPRAIEVPDDPE